MKEKAKKILKIAKTELMTNPAFTVAILGGTVAKIQAVCLSQFGTLLVSDCYTSHGGTKS